MSSQEEEPNADEHLPRNTTAENSDPGGGANTLAVQRKRDRRVSFAENTTVRLFERDEYRETPSTGDEKNSDDFAGELGFVLQPMKDFESEDGDDEEMDMQRSFLRPIGSPSSGGSNIGSASSIDEDNFYGPVSADFIRPGRFSDSAPSENMYDVTMDSTVFSMHLRGLDLSDSRADLKTPTREFEEKTITNANVGNSMEFTFGKKLIIKSPSLVKRLSTGDSSDMSLVGETLNKYEYDKLSPGLDEMLAKIRENINSVDLPDYNSMLTSAEKRQNEVSSSIDHVERGGIDSNELMNGEVSPAHIILDKENRTFRNGHSPQKNSPVTLGDAFSHTRDHQASMSPYRLNNNESENPLSTIVTTSSPVKQGQMLATSPSQVRVMTTPLPEQPDFFHKRIEHHDREASILRSMSKLETIALSFSAKVDKSTIKSMEFLQSPPSNISSKKDLLDSEFNLLENSCTKEVKEKINGLNKSGEESLGHIMNAALPNDWSSINLSRDLPKYRETAGSPPKIIWHGDNVKNLTFSTPKQSSESALATKTECLSSEIGRIRRAKHTPAKLVSSPGKVLDKFFPASRGLQSSNSEHLLLQNQFKTDKRQDSAAERNLNNASLSIVTASTDALIMGTDGSLAGSEVDIYSQLDVFRTRSNLITTPTKDNKSQVTHSKILDGGIQTGNKMSTFQHNIPVGEFGSVSPSENLDAPKLQENLAEFPRESPSKEPSSNPSLESVQLNGGIDGALDGSEVDIYSQKEVFRTRSNLIITPDRDKKIQAKHSKILDGGIWTGNEMSILQDNLPAGEFGTVSHGSVSPSETIDAPKLQNLAKFPLKSPSKELNSNSSLQSVQLTVELENISARKRNIELVLKDAQHRIEMSTAERNSKFPKSGTINPEIRDYPTRDLEVTAVTGDQMKYWTNIYSKFSVMEQIISRSGDELNNTKIDLLEDLLVHWKRSQTYVMLRAGLMHQNKTFCHDLKLKRVAESNLLLHQLAFEKAKLQLNHVKRERALKRLQLSSSGIQASQKYRTDISAQELKVSNAIVMVDQSQPPILNKGHECQVCPEMRQALEDSDRKIIDLKNAIHARCKTKPEQSCGDTIVLVNEHMRKMASNMFILQDVQMWVVHSVGKENGQHNVVLDYLGFVIQSIKFTIGPTSSAETTFILNEINIMKNFPNMDAFRAFAFVFNGETTRKSMGGETLAIETQVTSSRLGALLDVVMEVQLARVEFQNLIQSSFYSPSAEQLELKLCFFNFSTMKKVVLALDMCCLKSGIYPLDILPFQVASSVDGQIQTMSGPIFDEIIDALKSVRTGCLRILRLCRCVSQVVQDPTMQITST